MNIYLNNSTHTPDLVDSNGTILKEIRPNPDFLHMFKATEKVPEESPRSEAGRKWASLGRYRTLYFPNSWNTGVRPRRIERYCFGHDRLRSQFFMNFLIARMTLICRVEKGFFENLSVMSPSHPGFPKRTFANQWGL